MTMHAQVRNGSVYTNTARFDTGRSLSESEMRKLAPSIFAQEAHSSRSERFAAIPTIEVLRGLEKEGFFPVGVKQSRARDEDRADYTKHMIRLRRFDNIEKYQVDGNVCEIILKNANDGTSAYDLMAGMFRILCMNSLVAQTSTIDAVKVRHSGNAIENVIEGTYRVLGETEKLLAAPQDWSQINLNRDMKMVFAEAVHEVRFDGAPTSIKAEQFLIPRRADDRKDDLWTTFNVAQEAAIRGGLHGVGTDAAGRRRRTTTRQINGIDQDVKLNKALWVLTERMAAILKSAA